MPRHFCPACGVTTAHDATLCAECEGLFDTWSSRRGGGGLHAFLRWLPLTPWERLERA